jgi:hypothetical protein
MIYDLRVTISDLFDLITCVTPLKFRRENFLKSIRQTTDKTNTQPNS